LNKKLDILQICIYLYRRNIQFKSKLETSILHFSSNSKAQFCKWLKIHRYKICCAYLQ